MKAPILAFCLISSTLLAQNPAAPIIPAVRRSPIPHDSSEGDLLPENYLLKVVTIEKDKPSAECSVVVAGTQFQANFVDPLISISGSINPEKEGVFLVRYSMGVEIPSAVQNGSYTPSQFSTTVRLRLDEPIQISKSNGRSYQLSINRLPEGGKKSGDTAR